MLVLAMLMYVGITLSAPVWYWVVWGICALLQFVSYSFKMYKAGRDD